MEKYAHYEDFEIQVIINQLWQGFNILRGVTSTEDLHVYLYLLSAYYDGVIDVKELTSANDPLGYLKGALKSNEGYNDLYNYYESILNALPINVLFDLLQSLEKIDIHVYAGVFPEIFDDLLFKLLDNQGKSSGAYALPPEISSFVVRMTESYMPGTDYDFVFNPFAGLASLHPVSQGCYYEGQEINPSTWVLGKLRLLVKPFITGPPSYRLEDSIKNWPTPDIEDMYDIVISNPPFGMKIDSFYLGQNRTSKKISVEEYVIEKGLNSVLENGHVLCVASVGLLFRGGSEAKMRKRLVENNQLDTIVYFPGGLLRHTGIPFCLVIASRKGNSRNTIRMVDATKYVRTSGRNKILNSEALLENINSVDSNDSIRFVGVDEIRENDYNLNIQRYFLNKIEGVRLLDITKSKACISGISHKENEIENNAYKGPYVRIRDLKNDPFDYNLDLDQIENSEIPKYVKEYQGHALFLAKIGDNLKPTYFDNSGDSVFVSNDIIVLELNQSKININYLISELHSDYVLEQVKAFSSGTTISSISTKDILNIKIALPSLLEQEAKVQGAKTSYLQSIGRELRLKEELLDVKEQTDRNFKSVLHTMRQYLNALKTNVGGTSLFIEKYGNQGVNLNTIYSKNLNQTFGEHLTSLEGTITSMSKLLDSYENKDTSSKSEILMLESLVQEAQNRFKNPDKFKFEKVYVDHDAFSNELGYLNQYIDINKEDFFKVFSNIVFNAVDHGFTKKQVNYAIRTAILNGTEKGEFILEISNNGSPFPENFTYKDLITRGEKSTSSKGSGTGGSDIKTILSKYNAYFELISDEKDEFPVKYILHFPQKSIIDQMEQDGYPAGSYSTIKINGNKKDE